MGVFFTRTFYVPHTHVQPYMTTSTLTSSVVCCVTCHLKCGVNVPVLGKPRSAFRICLYFKRHSEAFRVGILLAIRRHFSRLSCTPWNSFKACSKCVCSSGVHGGGGVFIGRMGTAGVETALVSRFGLVVAFVGFVCFVGFVGFVGFFFFL